MFGVCVMSGVNPMDGELDIDVGSLFKNLWRNKYKILMASVVITGLTAGLVLMISPKYKAQTKVLITRGESILTRLDTGNADESKPVLDAEGVKSQVELMSSDDALNSVVTKYAKELNSEFGAHNNQSYFQGILNIIGQNPELGLTDTVIANVRENLKIYLAENTRVIVIEFSSKNPDLAKLIPEAVANTYIANKKAESLAPVTSAIANLEPEIARLQAEVQQSDAKVAAYRAQKDILIGQNNTEISAQQLSELSTEMSKVKAARSNSQAKAQSIRNVLASGGSIESIPEVLASPLMQQLRTSQVQLNREIADLATKLLDNHPSIKALRSQLKDLDAGIRSEASKIMISLETEAKTADLRESELQTKINGLKAETSRVGDDAVELKRLEDDAKDTRSLLSERQVAYKQALARNSLDTQRPDADIFSHAIKPTQSYFPKFVPIVSATFVASLLFLSVITLLRALFSGASMVSKSRDYVEVSAHDELAMAEAVVAIPVAVPVEVAPVNLATANAILHMPLLEQETENEPEPEEEIDSGISINSVATKLIDEGATCVVVVSPEGDEASASSILLSRNLSDKGLRIVLLDLTGNSAAARHMTDGLALAGITNLLAGTAQFGEIIHNDVYSEAHVIPTGTADPVQAAKAVERLPIIINALVSAYDMVIVECGPSSARGLKRLVAPGSGLLVSVIDSDHKAALAAMTDLIAAGFEDLILISPIGANNNDPMSNRDVA